MCASKEVTSMARGTAELQRKDEHVQVLDTRPPQEVDMSPPGNRIDGSSDPLERHMIDPNKSAPVMRNALEAPPVRPGIALTNTMQGTPDEEVPRPKMYRVEKTKSIVDRTSATRTTLNEGKEISSLHYNIRDLQRQGVQLRDITDIDQNAPL
jgi:hypothetical protein